MSSAPSSSLWDNDIHDAVYFAKNARTPLIAATVFSPPTKPLTLIMPFTSRHKSNIQAKAREVLKSSSMAAKISPRFRHKTIQLFRSVAVFSGIFSQQYRLFLGNTVSVPDAMERLFRCSQFLIIKVKGTSVMGRHQIKTNHRGRGIYQEYPGEGKSSPKIWTFFPNLW